MTNIQQQMKRLQQQVIRNDYYTDIYYNCLYAKAVSEDMIVLGIVSDKLIVEIANDFWLALPDTPAIRREPFWLLCDIAEHCFDEPDEWTGAEDDSVW